MTPEHPSSDRLLRRRQIVRAALAGALPLALPSLSRGERASAPLLVGGLPATCNLTLPVALTPSGEPLRIPTNPPILGFIAYRERVPPG
jgi:hypothetical protein